MEIKVFRFVIDSEAWENVVCANDTLTSILSRVEWGPRGDNYWSEPILNVWPSAFDIETALFAYDIKHDKLDEGEYHLYMTAAPSGYDYTGFGTRHVADMPGGMRLVAIPEERAHHYQVPRYRSGLHATWKVL